MIRLMIEPINQHIEFIAVRFFLKIFIRDSRVFGKPVLFCHRLKTAGKLLRTR